MILFLNNRHKYNNKNHKMFWRMIVQRLFFIYFASANYL